MKPSRQDLLGPYTSERAWAALNPPQDASLEEMLAGHDARVARSHYLHCRVGGLSHRKAYLRAYHSIDQHSGLYMIPFAISVLLAWRWVSKKVKSS